jgi:hypothetical protein
VRSHVRNHRKQLDANRRNGVEFFAAQPFAARQFPARERPTQAMSTGVSARLRKSVVSALVFVIGCRVPEVPLMQVLHQRLGDALARGELESVPRCADELEGAGDVRGARLARITLAERLHDSALLPDVGSESDSPQLSGALALAIYSTRGLLAAASQLRSACQNEARPPLRSLSCALAEQARLAEGRSLLEVGAPGSANVALFEGAPVPIVKASINGSAEELFVIDTGAANSVLSKSFCERARIPFDTRVQRQALDGAGNAVVLYPALVDRLQLEDFTLQNVPMFVMALPPELPIAGIIQPLDTFRHHSVDIDMRRHRMRLIPGDEAEQQRWTSSWGSPTESTPLIWMGTNVFIKARVDGLSGWFMFDTGASDNLVDRETARRLGHERNEAGPSESIVAAGASSTYGTISALLGVGAVAEPAEFSVRLEWTADPEQLFPLRRTGTIGSAWLRGRRIFLPRDGRSILFASYDSSH